MSNNRITVTVDTRTHPSQLQGVAVKRQLSTICINDREIPCVTDWAIDADCLSPTITLTLCPDVIEIAARH